MRNPPYAGPNDTGDFDGLTPDEARMLNSYRLLGDCFELSDDEDMFGRGWLIEGWRDLLEGHQVKLERAEREMVAAVRLARNESGAWDEIATVLQLPSREVRVRLDQPIPERG
ncbi:hypothetical protein D6T63_13440 [Arthrobacter cheniae]|uniref:Uncharacterized protein n=1 Tax=Arthrobacter cheniae TaxID=1258888 RepID=A0A3A5M3H6_9MICC|nr:hypothetical protein [Arthrobacter cheniae]RJT77960.1 hypothetical protein D6T63_13440 [Arthrobacter cheniae]